MVDRQELRRDDALRIEQRRQVHPHHADYAPEKLRVLKEGHGGGQQQAHARDEAQQTQHVENEQQQRRSERRPGDQHDSSSGMIASAKLTKEERMRDTG